MKYPPVSMIVAMTHRGGVIGNKGKMPWHLPLDLQRFKHLTRNSAIVMGPKTYKSIGRPLEGRLNIILTTNREHKAPPGVLLAHDPRQALELAAIHGRAEFFVIGGAMVYRSFLPMAERLFVTYVKNAAKGDTTFPYWNKDLWHEVWIQEKYKKLEGNSHPTKYAEYQRKLAPLPKPKDGKTFWELPDEAKWKKKKKKSKVSKKERTARLLE
jgi:dihydrofolate reductase